MKSKFGLTSVYPRQEVTKAPVLLLCCCVVALLLLLLYEAADIVAGVNCYKKTVNHLMAGPQLSGVEVSVTSPVKDDHC